VKSRTSDPQIERPTDTKDTCPTESRGLSGDGDRGDTSGDGGSISPTGDAAAGFAELWEIHGFDDWVCSTDRTELRGSMAPNGVFNDGYLSGVESLIVNGTSEVLTLRGGMNFVLVRPAGLAANDHAYFSGTLSADSWSEGKADFCIF